ncbi:MAG: cysteine synthase [Clostridia bacterium]|nr:cysteine synthase [Clostridia bacterium]
MDVAMDVTKLIGKTPVVRLNCLVEDSADVYVKLEYFNPGASIKDRVALNMIEEAEANGDLRPGGTIVEPTSGNTGIGLALISAIRGYRLILVMPDTMSIERRKLLAAYGAEIILTPGELGMRGSVEKAMELVNENPDYFMPQQFENPANPAIHRQTTAREIIKQMDGELDALVIAVGTGGTITGIGEVLKVEIPDIRIIAVEPAASPVLSGGQPGFHKIQGIGAGFIPKVLSLDLIDDIITVTDEEAMETSRRLAREEGLLVGISSGAAISAALKVGRIFGKGKKVMAIAPDSGERYLSTDLFSVDV